MSNRRDAPVWVKGNDKYHTIHCYDCNGLIGLADLYGVDYSKLKATTPCGMAKQLSKHMDIEWCPSKPLNGGHCYYPDYSKMRR